MSRSLLWPGWKNDRGGGLPRGPRPCLPEVLPARGGRAGCLPCGVVWKKHCEAVGKALKDFSRGLCHACFFRRWGHSRLTPESSRYTPKGLRRTATSRLVAIQAPARAAATARGTALFRVGLSR